MSDEKKKPKEIRWSEGFRRPDPSEEDRGFKKSAPPQRRRDRQAPHIIRRDRPSHRAEEPRQEVELRSWVRKAALLKTEKGREKEQRFLADGVKCVDEIARYSSAALVKVAIAPGFNHPELMGRLKKLRVEIEELPIDQLNYLSTTVTHQGIVALCNQATLRPKWETARMVTLVDSVQDPGNLGALFRTSLAFGMDALVLGQGTVDPFNPKVVRGSSGTFLRLPFEKGCDLAERYQFLRSKGFTIVATSPHARLDLSQIKMRRKVAFLIGNEGAGADQRLIDAADETVRIPMSQSLESLNVAVAHGIISAQLWQMRGD